MTGKVDAALLDRLMTEVSRFGATGDGGVDRQAGSTAHGAARDWLRAELAARGYEVRVDAIGNVFGILNLAGGNAPLVMTGSHLDSQPAGGRFDGAYGVVAAIAALDALRAAVAAGAPAPGCNFCVVDWMNEEGARFQPSLLGSGVYAGELDLDYALARADGDGHSVRDELARTGYLGTDPAPRADAYVEFHIEGNDALETAGLAIGPFARYWGAVKYRAVMKGERAHTGPTAMPLRRDAGLGAAHVITGLRAMSDARDGALYTSVGRLVVEPNSPNMIPDRATMFIELRAPDPAMLEDAEGELNTLLAESAAAARVEFEILSIDRRPAGVFDADLVRLAEREAAARGLGTMRLDTIGGHDAVPVSRTCPAVVVTVPSVGGVIHHPDEFSRPEDLEAGANVLLGMLAALGATAGDVAAAAGADQKGTAR
ncbi:MAG: Zn-dependent hydrolase [Rhodobacteraceae bacterium]|nr:Zn-dependent hydrolase [Paracoccaceae bacterium]